MTKPVSVVFYGGFAIIFLGILSPLISEYLSPRPELPKLLPAPEFQLLDSEGARFSSSSLQGKVWIANFIFTRCPGPCAAQSAHISQLAESFQSAPKVQFLSISVDGDHDTPEVMAAYAAKHHADTSRWHFLTESQEKIVELLNKGFRLGSLEEPKYHSTRFVLVDPQGVIRGYYQGTEEETVARLEEDISSLY